MGVDADFNLLRENPQLFDNSDVYNMLRKLIQTSCIDQHMRTPGSPMGSKTNEQAKFIGYFASIQLMRYHLMLGEYDVALRTADSLDLNTDEAMYYRCPSSHMFFMYLTAFALFMTKRYSDCMNVCAKLLWFLMKIQRLPVVSAAYEAQS